VQTLFKAFDKNGDGTIDYDEFLRVVKGPMSKKRVALVKRAYKVLDRDGSGEVDYNDICDTYNASQHPAVLEGRKTERQILDEFLATFEMALSGVADGIVTMDEFLEYYSSVSASIDNEDYFEQMIDASWNISGDAAQYRKYAKGVAIDETKPATASRPKNGGSAAGSGAGSYGGFAKKNTGKATM
jgi:Ca2+-binding EF-hand superfamily protein